MVLIGVDQRLARSALGTKRVDDSVSDAIDHGCITDVPAGDAGNHRVLVVRGADVVVPALGYAVKAQYQALAGVLIFGLTPSRGRFSPVEVDGLGRVERGTG